MESTSAPDPGTTVVGATHTLLPDYTEDEDADDADTMEDAHRHRLTIGDSMDVEEDGAAGGLHLSADAEEGQNLSLNASNDSVSEKARVFILKNRKKTAGDDKMSSGKNTQLKEVAAVAPPRPPVPPATQTFSDAGKVFTDKLDFPSQFFTIRAARLRAQNITTLGGVPGFSRLGGDSGRPDNGFRVEGDMRSFTVMNFHRTDANRNISSSVTVDLECLACATPHSLRDNNSSGVPVVVVLADQAFPPMIPGQDGRCIVIIRVEDGLLFELEQAFTDILAELLGPTVSLPRGSVVLLGSSSHLGGRGLVSYVTNLCGTIASLGNKTGSGVEVIPFVPVPVCGLGGGGLIRDLFDLDAWILGSALGPGIRLEGTRRAFWEVMGSVGDGINDDKGVRTFFIPADCRNPRKRVFRSQPPVPALPASLPPLSSLEEKKIVCALISDLNGFYGINLDPSPSLERGVSTQGSGTAQGRTILVGASHMVRLGEKLGHDTISLAIPGFRPKENLIANLVSRLRLLKLESCDTVILDLLSNTTFMGTDGDGLPCEAFRAEDGKYHVIGSLTIAPASFTKKVLAMCQPLCDELRKTGCVLVSPVPRYVNKKCCNEAGHIDNFDDVDRDDEIAFGLEGVKRLLHAWATENNLTYEIIDPTMLNDSCDLGINTRVSNSGQQLWSDDDPVHLTSEGYRDLADLITAHIRANAYEDSMSEHEVGSVSNSLKRRLPDPVITRPGGSTPKRGKTVHPPRHAGWLVGRMADTGKKTG